MAVKLINRGRKQTTEHIKNNIESRRKHFDKIGRKSKKISWLFIRFSVFERDNWTCQYCGRKSPIVELQIDHKYPQSKGGMDELENYIIACSDCNLGKGDYILKEYNK